MSSVTCLVPFGPAPLLSSLLEPLRETHSVKPTLLATVLFGLLSVSTVDVVAAGVRADRPIDVELDRLGSLKGAIAHFQGPSPDSRWVLVYRGRRLVAKARLSDDGGFHFERLNGGLYWFTAPGVGQAVRAWAAGTAPPQSPGRLVLASASSQPQPLPTPTIVRGQAPAPPLASVTPVPTPAYPFQPYQVPGGRMMMPGTYTSPGSVFFNPLLTAAVVTGIVGVIVVATDDDDDSPSAASSGAQADQGNGADEDFVGGSDLASASD